MTLYVTHRINDAIEVANERALLLRYVYRPHDPPAEAPKPYLHPVRTLAGQLVTAHRPHDHVWHKGIAITCPHVNDQNFWGGPTFHADRGYVHLDNCGTQHHEEWDQVAVDDEQVQLVQRLTWVTSRGDRWLDERRTLTIAEIASGEGHYALDVEATLRNVSDEELSFGSPTTHGRPQAGYGGLFWRGPRSFAGGQVLAADGREGAETIMGTQARWLAYLGRHDGVDATSTLLFIDDPTNPITWFVRSEPFAAVSFAFAFHEELPLRPGEAFALRHRLVIADGAWTPERIRDYVEARPQVPTALATER